MSLKSQQIKNLVAGISQQPNVLRHPEQLAEQINGMSTEVGGLQKRPPTLFVAKLDGVDCSGERPLVHTVVRDENEKYVMIFAADGIHIWDLAGNQKTVNYTGTAKDYLPTSNIRKSLKVVTIADYTFVMNTTKTIKMTADVSPNKWATQGALINIKSGQYGRAYKIFLDGIEKASFQTPDGAASSDTNKIDTNYIAGQLANQLTTNGYTTTTGEGWVYVTHPTIPITSVATKDGYNNQAMYGMIQTVQKFSMVPASAPDGFTVKITGEPSGTADDYYITYVEADKVWKETVRPNILNTLDAETMPHVLVREADGTFTFKGATWDKRNIGDDDSNALPSMVNQVGHDVFFFRNRLGILAGENILLSSSGEFFNFWMFTATDVIDSDTIDVAVSDNQVATLYNAIPFNEQLLMFSKKAQFIAGSDGVLTPKNIVPNKTTAYESNVSAKPVMAGKNAYFIVERAEFSSVFEYYVVNTTSDIKDAQSITSHVPSYIPNGVHKLIANTAESLLLVLTEGAPSSIYVYKYLFIDEQKVQASWSKWDFGDCEVCGGGFDGSTLYLVINRNGSVFLEKMTFSYNTLDFPQELYRVFMDRKILTDPIPAEKYNASTQTTTLNLLDYFETLTSDDYGLVDDTGLFKAIEGTTVTLEGDYTGRRVIIGQLFNLHFEMSQLMIKKTDDNGTTSVTEGRLQIKNMWFDYSSSGHFKVTVEHIGKDTFTYDMTARVLGSPSNILGALPQDTGEFKFPVQSSNTTCKISVDSPYPNPVAIIGAGWEGNYTARAQRI